MQCLTLVIGILVGIGLAMLVSLISNHNAEASCKYDYSDGDTIIKDISTCVSENIDAMLESKEAQSEAYRLKREQIWTHIQEQIDTAICDNKDTVIIKCGKYGVISLKEIKNVLRRKGYKVKVYSYEDDWLGRTIYEIRIDLGAI